MRYHPSVDRRSDRCWRTLLDDKKSRLKAVIFNPTIGQLSVTSGDNDEICSSTDTGWCMLWLYGVNWYPTAWDYCWAVESSSSSFYDPHSATICLAGLPDTTNQQQGDVLLGFLWPLNSILASCWSSWYHKSAGSCLGRLFVTTTPQWANVSLVFPTPLSSKLLFCLSF